MTRQDIVKAVVKIILKHAKPTRIYLYGSEANGEATSKSDIDIAFDDEKFRDDYLINDDIENLRTLVKVEVKNIARAETRFANRVKATGRVLYSANKKLRAEDGLYNFSKACKRFAEAVKRREELVREGYSDIYLDLIVKRFEFTYEMSWKAIKRYLSSVGIECLNPRDCFKEALVQGLISDEEIWLDMLERRNLSSHIYDQDEISEVLDRIDDYKKSFTKLKINLEKHLKKQQRFNMDF